MPQARIQCIIPLSARARAFGILNHAIHPAKSPLRWGATAVVNNRSRAAAPVHELLPKWCPQLRPKPADSWMASSSLARICSLVGYGGSLSRFMQVAAVGRRSAAAGSNRPPAICERIHSLDLG